MSSYKIKDVETLTGVKSHTLRIWEKRYGLPKPSRSNTKIRNYSEDDLLLLLNVAILNQGGLKISKIAGLSEEEIYDKVLEQTESCVDENTTIGLLINAMINYDEIVFKNVIQKQIDIRGLKQTYFNFILPFLERIGVMWMVGSIIPSQEHLVSNIIREIIIRHTKNIVEKNKGSKTYALFCREGDWHELSLLMYNYLLRDQGNQTFYLGQNLPIKTLLNGGLIKKCDAVVLSLVSAIDKKSELKIINTLNNIVAEQIPVYLGGGQSSSIKEKLKNPLILDARDLFG